MKLYKMKVGDLVVQKGHEKDKGVGIVVEEEQASSLPYVVRVMFKDSILWYTKKELKKVWI